MKRIIVLLVCIFVLVSPLCAKDLEYKPYEDGPIWSMNMRRGSSLFFGSLVFTMPIASIITSFLPLNYDSQFSKFGYTAMIASGLSVSIATVDYIMGINE